MEKHEKNVLTVTVDDVTVVFLDRFLICFILPTVHRPMDQKSTNQRTCNPLVNNSTNPPTHQPTYSSTTNN